MTENESGEAADTGSAAHLAIAAFHRGEKVADAIAAMREASAAFPRADLDRAAKIVTRYTDDPRNRDAEVVEVEKKIRCTIEPRYVEGPPIVIEGTADQIRRVDGRLTVWDVKTGDREGLYMQNVYALQLAAYSLATGHEPGGYIRTKAYFTRGAGLPDPDNAFVPAAIPDPDKLLDAVRWAVCAIREGYVVATPGEHCGTCWFQGSEFCVPKLGDYLKGKK